LNVPPLSTQRVAHAHIVALRLGGEVLGYQLRVGNGGAGQTKAFASRKYGGAAKALATARRTARELGLLVDRKRGGSSVGRRTSRSPTPAAGIGFAWHEFATSTVLYVTASWCDKTGAARHTCYSTERHGLDGALDKAIAARTSCGAPMPDRNALLKALQAARRSNR
jgi:hypothetical protein